MDDIFNFYYICSKLSMCDIQAVEVKIKNFRNFFIDLIFSKTYIITHKFFSLLIE
jgi:hypothetical protein